jgi:hypothetical protein
MTEVLYIGGWGRSGSTALEDRLRRYDRVCGLGELRFLWQRGWVRDETCACGRRFSDCPFWQEVLSVARRTTPLSPRHLSRLSNTLDSLPKLGRAARTEAGRRLIADYVTALDAVVSAASEVSGRRILIDSSKSASQLVLLAMCPSVRVKLIHLVRSPLGVARSWRTVRARPEAGAEQRYMTRSSPAKSAVLWLLHNYGVEVIGTNLGGVVGVRQCDLLARPAAEVRRIFDALDVDPGEPEPARDWHSVAGNPSRLDGEVAPPLPDLPATTLAEHALWAATAPGRRRWLT